ncbi:MAG: ribonuclease HII [Anaplasmataceae bacterium]|nr:ribonuclease HII [Anaplasmataceae bacterium]
MDYIIGIDEVGRGSLAGPVTVCAFLWPKNLQLRKISLEVLKDSKKLTAKKREFWAKSFKKTRGVAWGIGHSSPQRIDRINISRASNEAATKAIRNLENKLGFKVKKYQIYLDGGLFILNKGYKTKTIIGGDTKIKAIMAASIIAKVTRDDLMRKISNNWPQYAFETHKGYGTKKHYQRLKKFGPSKEHRLTFLKKITIL